MIGDHSYRKSLIAAVLFHLFLALALIIDTTSHQRPVLTPATSQALPIDQTAPREEGIVKAVSVDKQEVKEVVERLKQERSSQLKAEQARQQALSKQAEMARQQIARLKEEADKLAIARKKQITEENQRLKQLAEQKAQETKRIEALKAKERQLQKQQQEAEKLALLKQAQEKAKNDKLREELARAEKARIEEKQRQASLQQKAQAEQDKLKEERARAERASVEAKQRQARIQQQEADAEKKMRIAGEVNKYKAMIVNAISRQWILPENVDPRLSSQFRIRLAPDGAVLEVNLIRSSGDPVLDRSAQTAIYKASPLPVPHDPDTFNLFRDISLTVRPENVRG